MTRTDLGHWLGLSIAGGRVVLGAAALLRPDVAAQPWVGAALAGRRPVRMLGRALGGRDLSMGLVTVWALRAGASSRLTAVCLAASGFADAVDAAATVSAWHALPPNGRVLVLLASSGAAVSGAAAAAAA